MEFQKFTNARFSFCQKCGNRDCLFPTFTFLYFSLSHFFSSLHKQSDLALPLSMFSIFRFRVRFIFLSLSLSLFFFGFSHMQTHLFLTLSLSKSGYCANFFFCFSYPHSFNSPPPPSLYIQINHTLRHDPLNPKDIENPYDYIQVQALCANSGEW